MSNAQSGATYEALLIDNITAPAQRIAQTLAQLETAFKGVTAASAPFAQNMQVIAAAMRQAGRGPSDQAIGLGMVFNRVSEMSSQLGSSAGRAIEGIGRVMQTVGVAAVGMAGAVTYAMGDIIKAAGDATETLNAFHVVIESTTNRGKAAIEWADDFSKTLGRSSIQTKKSMTTYQSLWKGLGATGAEATKLTKAMVQLQTDFSSFFNVTDDESLRRFIAALSGSSEVLDQFGINIRENALEAKGLELGFGGNVRKMTEYQKAIARAAILSDVLGKRIGALGDAARTQFEWANQVRIASAALLDLKVKLGQLIIPELKPYLQAVVAVLKDIEERAKAIDGKNVRDFVGGLLAMAGIGASLFALGTALAAVGSAVTIAAIGFAGLMTSVGALVAGGPIAAAIVAVTGLVVAITGLVFMDAGSRMPLAQIFEDLKAHAQGAVDSITVGMAVIRKALLAADYGTAWEAFKLSATAVFYEVAIAFNEIMGHAIEALAVSIAKVFRLGGLTQLGAEAGMAFGGALDTMEAMPAKLQAVNDQLAKMNAALAEPKDVNVPNAKGIADAFINMAGLSEVITSQQAWKVVTDAGESLRAGFEAARKEADKIKQKANDWADDMLSPVEKFIKELQNIKLMESMNVGGRVTKEMVERAQQQAAEKLLNELPKPPKFQAMSVGTFNRAVAGNINDFAPAFDAQLEEMKKQTQIQELIRKGVDAMNNNQLRF